MKWLLTYSGSIVLFLFGIYFDVVKIAVQNQLTLKWCIIFSIVAILTLLLQRIGLNIKPNIEAESIRDPLTQEKKARRGLVVFLSLYQNFKTNLSEQERVRCIQERDYKTLQIDDTSATNFGHAINAIKANLYKLEHLWIITTESFSKAPGDTPDPKGTSDYLPVFRAFLEKELFVGRSITIHASPELRPIEMDEDSAICRKTSDLIQEIYQTAASSSCKLKPRDVIVDTTGGLTSMKIGAVLASLKKDQNIEIIGSEYNRETGRPIGGDKSFPVIIGFNPVIQKVAPEA